MRIGILFSSGKDSCNTIDYFMAQGWEIACLISILPQHNESWMFQKPNELLIKAQAQAMGIPLVSAQSKGEKETELTDLKKAIASAQQTYNITGVAVGALASDYQQERVNRICEELNIKCFAPLWHVKQQQIMENLIEQGFDVRMISVTALGLNKDWIGKKLTRNDIKKLTQMHKEFGLHIAGEGGEFETCVLDAPMFKKRIEIIKANIVEKKEHEAFWQIQEITLKEKN